MRSRWRRTRLATACASATLLGATFPTTAQAQMSWTGPAGGLWSEEDNWDPKVVPQNAPPTTFYSPVITSGGATVDGGFNIAGLTNQGTVVVPLGGGLGFDAGGGAVSINNTGTISIAPGTMSSAIGFAGNTIHTISGNGTILLGGAGTARVIGNPNSTLRNEGNTVFGEGNFIEGVMEFSNAGTVTASGGILRIQTTNTMNTGLMRALSGATLSLNGASSIWDNSGTILAEGGCVQLFNNMTLRGGVLSTSSGGTIEAIAGGLSTITLKNVENKGAFYVRGATTELEGEIKNSGSITLKAGNIMRPVNGTATLSSGGTILMEANSKINSSGTLSKFVNSSNKIIGVGEIGDETLKIENGADGLIRASGGILIIRPTGFNGFFNAGTMEARDGGVLGFVGGGEATIIFNHGGVIHAGPNSQVVFRDAAWVNGGVLSAEGNGLMGVPHSTVATLESVTLNAPFQVDGTLVTQFAILGSGPIFAAEGSELQMEQSESFASVQIYKAIVRKKLGGGSFSHSREAEPDFTNNGVFEGAGSLGTNTMGIVNNGTILANVNVGSVGIENPMWINPSAGGFVNNGVIESLGTGVAVLDGAGGGAFTQQGGGIIRALSAGSNVRLVNSAILSGGMLGAGAGSVSIVGTATLSDLTSNASLAQVGGGTLHIDGNFTHNGSITTPPLATLLVAGGSTFGGGAGAIVNNGRLIVSTGATLDVGSVEGTGSVIVQANAQAKVNTMRQAALTIGDDSVAVLKSNSSPSRNGAVAGSLVGSLSISSQGVLDITDKGMAVNYSGGSPLSTIVAHIASGYAGGSWTGPGIRSSIAAADTHVGIGYAEANQIGSPPTFLERPIDATTVVFRLTWTGDADLDGDVDIGDLGRLASHWQAAGRWFDGDFDYTGTVNINDLGMLATNWQAGVGNPLGPSLGAALTTLGLPSVSIPEPIALCAVLTAAAMTRRRGS
jgi:hypothetical protein